MMVKGLVPVLAVLNNLTLSGSGTKSMASASRPFVVGKEPSYPSSAGT